MDLARELHLELLGQLVLAVLLGGAIGLERELRGKPAGLRTNILICIGATLFTSLSFQMAAGRGDPGRVAAQVLAGVGFIGAGTIVHARGAVTGLTSAATIWVVAAVGMALGAGAYVDALGTALLVVVVLEMLLRLEDRLGRRETRSRLVVQVAPEEGIADVLAALVTRTGLEVEGCTSRREGPDLVVELELRGAHRLHEQALVALLHHPQVRAAAAGE